MEKTISIDHWKQLLSKFSDEVANNHYERVKYDYWKILTNFQVNYLRFEFLPIREDKKVIICQDIEKNLPIQFPLGDNSIGDFLYNELFAVSDKRSQIAEATNKKENNNMKDEDNNMKNFNFDFGPCTDDQVRLSMYGLAVKNRNGNYVSYNPNTKEVVDVDILNFDGGKFMYKIPVAIKDIAVGDIVIHNRVPMFVIELPAEGDNAITCIDVVAGERKQIIATTNMFGFNFITKIVSLFNTLGENAPTADSPFGNMLPLMMLSNGDNEDFDPMMLMLMAGNGKLDMSNPLMVYMMCRNSTSDVLPMMFMMKNMQ